MFSVKALLIKTVKVSAFVSIAIACAGCYEIMKASPAPITGFMTSPGLLKEMDAHFPFDRFWYDSTTDWGSYTKIKIVHVSTDYQVKDSLWETMNSEYIFESKETDYISKYLKTQFEDAVRRHPYANLCVVDTPDKDTLVLYLSLTQLVPRKVLLGSTATVAGLFIPGASLAGIFASGCLAMEGQLVDPKSNKIVMMFTIRESDDAALLFNIRDFTWNSHAEYRSKEWADDFIKVLRANNKTSIEKPFPMAIIGI